MKNLEKKLFIPVQRCYPDEYRTYQTTCRYLDDCRIPVEVFRIRFRKVIEMVLYPNACVLLSFEQRANGGIGVRYIGRITETVCTTHRDDTLYFQLRFPPQFVFRQFAGQVNQIIELDPALFGGAEAIAEALAGDDMERTLDRLLELVRASEAGLHFNPLIDRFVLDSILSEEMYSIERIVSDIHYSARYVRAVIKDNLGISSKRLFDILRLQNIMDSQIGGDGDPLNCVYDNGFFDQTHMNKNIRKLTGLSYTSFRSILKAKNR